MNDSKKKDLKKRPIGRLVKSIIKPTDASPEDIARVICLSADKKLQA